MAINIGARRFAKAQKRKAAVAEKRKAELQAGSLSGQVRSAAADPIQHCSLSEALLDTGMGMLVVARGATPYHVTMTVFLLDTFALGVKDAYLRSLSGRQFADTMDRMAGITPMRPVEPSYARKLMHDLVTWSRGLGVAPHRDYAKCEPIFGTVDAAACDVEFRFGYEGKPLFIGDMSGLDLVESDGEFEIVDDLPDGVLPGHAAPVERHDQAD